MRKLAIFLVVFLGGFAALFFVSRYREEKREAVAPIPIERPPQVEEQVPTEVPTDDGTDGVQVVSSGAGTFTEFDDATGRIITVMRHEDSRQLAGNRHELIDVEVESFDPETGERRAVLTASRAEAVVVPETGRLSVDPDTPVRFEDAVLLIEEEGRLAPVTISLPWVHVWPKEERFDSDAPVTVEGVGLSASSLGIRVRDLGRRMSLPKKGDVRLVREDEGAIRLSATDDGVIDVRRVEGDDTDLLTVVATDGARFEWVGDEPLEVEARTIEITTEVRGGEAEQRYRVLEAEARGEVSMDSRVALSDESLYTTHFEGDRARFAFAADGEMRGAVLSGSPRGEFVGAPDQEDAGLPTGVEVSGAGPLVVGFGDTAGMDLGFALGDLSPDVGFTMEGPGRLTLRGVALELDASRRLTGAMDLAAKRARAKLSGDVEARGEDGRFTGAELDLVVEGAGTDDAFAVATTDRPAVLETVEGAADPWRIETDGELELHVRRGRFDVPLAHNIHVENTGPAGLTLDAGRLTDFLWLDRTFRADEDVSFDTPHGFGSAQRVEALSATNRMFVGTQEEPANFVFRDRAGRQLGELDARRVWVTPGVVQAEEDVAIVMEAEQAEHELDCDRAVLRSPLIVEDTAPDAVGEFHVDAYGVRRALLRTPDGEAQLVCDHLEVSGRAARNAEEGRTTLVIDGYEAEGGVTAKVVDRQEMTVSGRRFVWSEQDGGRGFVEPEPGKRMTAVGRLPDSELPYDLTADRIEFTRESLHAERPLIDFEVRMLVPEGETHQASSVRQVMSEHLVADETGALFSGDVHLTGWADKESEQPWTLDAGSVHLAFEQLRESEEVTATNVREVVAWNGIEIQVGDDQRARADLLYLDYRTLRLEGAPAVFDLRGFTWESSGMEFDVYDVLLSTEQGTIRAAEDTDLAGWTVRYESMEPFPREDDTILALRNAVCSNGTEQVRADWMLFWVDRDEWRRSAESWLDMPIDTTGVRVDMGLDDDEGVEAASEQPVGDAPNVFGALDAGAISHILREVYLEGDIQVRRKGAHASRFSAIYIDLVDGHGWVEDAELTLKLKSRGHTERVSLKSQLLRHSADGSLHADAATVTTCMFAKPEYVIETGDLSLVPDRDPDVSWRVSVKKNKLRFQDTVKFEIPLPPIKNAAVDQRGRPVIQGISFGNSSRYGNFVSLGFSNEIGDTVTEGVARAMGASSEDVDGSYSLRARWLSSRGLLLQGGLELDVGEKFWSELYLAGINDDADDVGIVRVPTDERSAPRWGLTFRSRYLLTEQEWFDFVLAKSSDAGFQSEFFEPEFTSFEERQTYVHWRKANDAQYYSAIVQVRLDDFRNEVERLPEAGFYQGLEPVGELFGEPLLWVGDADVGYLRRLEGSGTARSPFDPVFVDPYGERESGRVLTTQRLEVPVHVGGSGIRFTPYTAVTGQAWTEGVDPDSSPARAALFAGAELSGEFHRVLPGNYLNTIVPSIGFRGDLADVEEGGDPIPFDRNEEPLTGNVVDLVLRSRFTRPQDKRRFDIGLRTAYAYETTKSQDDGWLPLSVLSEFYTEYKDIPVGFTYDMRFDFEESNTVYSRSALGLEPWEPLGLEFGYNRGLDSAYERLYEAASIAARWDINWKWDLEGRQTISLKGEDNLYSEFTLRRYGHDLFFEVRYAMRQGEGSSISFGLKPVVGHRLDSLGLLDAWKEAGLR